MRSSAGLRTICLFTRAIKQPICPTHRIAGAHLALAPVCKVSGQRTALPTTSQAPQHDRSRLQRFLQ